MIKILPTGTSAIVKYGLKPIRNAKSRGRLGDGAKEHSFETGPVNLHALWRDNRIEADIRVNSEIYLRSITLDFRFRSPRHSGDTTVWTESCDDEYKIGNINSVPGTYSQKANRDGAWAIWISEAADREGLFFKQSPPSDYPIHFHCKPLSRVLKIRWDIFRNFQEGETLKLPDVGISRGRIEKILPSWQREWERTSHREILRDRRVGWCGDEEIQSPKDLREILTAIRSRRIKIDWYAIGPNYAAEIGDWLSPSDNFRDRMGSLSRTIGEQNIIPGLRFAPLLVSKKSVLASEKPEWLVKAANGSSLTVPAYSGRKETLYVLDITHPEVLNHIKKTFTLMKDQWGFRVYYLERMGAAAVPGIRRNNSISSGTLLKTLASAVRETLGNRVLITASGFPLLSVPDIWDARVLTPPVNHYSDGRNRKKRRNYMSVTSALLHKSSWNESAWVNSSGLLPVSIFRKECDSFTESLRTAVFLSAGMVTFSGDPRTISEDTRNTLLEFLSLFQNCRDGRLSIIPDIGGGSVRPLVVRNSNGWIGLFNFSFRKKEVRLAKEEMKNSLGVLAALSSGENTVFNSPEIHVALPPMGCRLFRG